MVADPRFEDKTLFKDIEISYKFCSQQLASQCLICIRGLQRGIARSRARCVAAAQNHNTLTSARLQLSLELMPLTMLPDLLSNLALSGKVNDLPGAPQRHWLHGSIQT